MRARALLGLCTLLVVGLSAVTASADPNGGPKICPGTETAISGTHGNLTVTGNVYVAAFTTLNVKGNLTIAPHACLDAFTLGEVHVRGDILVGRGAILALGCTPFSIGPGVAPCYNDFTKDTVDGSIVAKSAWTMYLDGDTIHGNLISDGGGPGVTLDPYVNFPIKDNVIDGNVLVVNWKGAWFGFIRNVVTHGNVTIRRNQGANPDANEVVTNTVAGNMTCIDNTPSAQIGDSGGSPNSVGGTNVGCP